MAARVHNPRDRIFRRAVQFCYAVVALAMLIIVAIVLPGVFDKIVSRWQMYACQNVLGVAIGLVVAIVYDRFYTFRNRR